MKKNFEITDVEVDIYCTISIFDRDFYIGEYLDAKISYIAKSIIVCEIDEARYASLEYIRINIFLVDKSEKKLLIIKIS